MKHIKLCHHEEVCYADFISGHKVKRFEPDPLQHLQETPCEGFRISKYLLCAKRLTSCRNASKRSFIDKSIYFRTHARSGAGTRNKTLANVSAIHQKLWCFEPAQKRTFNAVVRMVSAPLADFWSRGSPSLGLMTLFSMSNADPLRTLLWCQSIAESTRALCRSSAT